MVTIYFSEVVPEIPPLKFHSSFKMQIIPGGITSKITNIHCCAYRKCSGNICWMIALVWLLTEGLRKNELTGHFKEEVHWKSAEEDLETKWGENSGVHCLLQTVEHYMMRIHCPKDIKKLYFGDFFQSRCFIIVVSKLLQTLLNFFLLPWWLYSASVYVPPWHLLWHRKCIGI